MRRRIAALAAAMGVFVAACGSDGAPAQPEDDFLDKVEAICRATEKELDRLDLGGGGADAALSYHDLLVDATDDMSDLDPPASLSKDFDNLVGDLNDQADQAERLAGALDSGSDISSDVSAMLSLAREADNAARALGAFDCAFLAPDGLSSIGSGTTATTPEVTIPIDTTPDTVPPSTSTLETIPPETTLVSETTTPTTEVPVYPLAIETVVNLPAGYSWNPDFNQIDVADLYTKTGELGPLVQQYAAGDLISDADGTYHNIYAMWLSTPFTDLLRQRWFFWERIVDDLDPAKDTPEQQTTPGGLTVYFQAGAFTGSDCWAWYSGSFGFTVCVSEGGDAKPMIDAFVAANPA